MVTLTPVSAVKASTHSLVRLSCWALYTVISPETASLEAEAADEPVEAGVPLPAQAVRPSAALAASAIPASALLRIFIEGAAFWESLGRTTVPVSPGEGKLT
jgi:hypothetical protein